MKVLRLSLFLIFILPAIATAQSKKIPVAVEHTNRDLVGQGVAFALKDAIRGSNSFFLIDSGEIMRPRIVVKLLSSETPANASMFAVAFVYENIQTPGGILLRLSIGFSDRDQIDPAAKAMLPTIDQAVEHLKEFYPALWQTL